MLSLFSRLPDSRAEWGLMYPVLAGFSFVTAYAGYFSLFSRVGLTANILLCIICVICLIFDRHGSTGIKISFSPLQMVMSLCLIFVILFFTSYGVFHSDSGLYHAQSIRWIEEYGVVKGLGLVQNRFAYNSAFFCVSALYSFSFLGQSLHGVNGFMAVIVSLYALYDLTESIRIKGTLKLRVFIDLAPLLYTVIGGRELISPTTDPILLYFFFAVMILWSREIEKEDTPVMVYSLLCILTVFLVSVKLSLGVLVLLTVQPAVILIRDKKIKEILISAVSGVVLILPYFIRNIIISGWLIYPFPSLDLFDLPWKVPYSTARHDADEITVWARYVRDTDRIGDKIWEWAPDWWNGQTGWERFLSAAAIAAFIAGTVWCISAFIRLVKRRDDHKKQAFLQKALFLEIIMICGSLFWFLSAPLIRYGVLYLLLLPLMTVGVIINDKDIMRPVKPVFGGILILLMAYPLCGYLGSDISYMHDNRSRQYLVRQKDYPEAKVKEKEYCGTVFFYPEEPGTPVWYKAFPSVLYEDNLDFMEPVGDSIKDGFRIRKE